MITKVVLRNWKSHEETEMEFEGGTNVLVGIMGSGKSAVLDAVTYALFGTVPAVRDRRISLDDLIKNRPVEKNEAEVSVEFATSEDVVYRVRRMLVRRKGTDYAELRRRDGTLIEKPKSSNVTEHVTSLLQIDFDFFRRMIYSEQNQLDRFLTLNPAERRRRVDELLRINKFEKARKNTTSLRNRLSDRKQDRQEDLDELQEDEEIENLPSLEEELRETISEKQGLIDKKSEIGPRLEDVKKKLNKLEKKKDEIEKLGRAVESLKGSKKTLESQINQIKIKLGEVSEIEPSKLKEKVRSLNDSMKEKMNKLSELEEELNSKTAEVSKLETKKKSLGKDLKRFEERIEEKEQLQEKFEKIDLSKISKKTRDLKKRLKDYNEKRSDLRARIENLAESIANLTDAQSTCPTCGRRLDEPTKSELIRDKSEEKDRLTGLKTDLDDKIGETERGISNYEERKEKGRELQKRVEDLSDLKSKVSKIRESYEGKSGDLEKRRKEKNLILKKRGDVKKKLDEIREDTNRFQRMLENRNDLKSAREERKIAVKKLQKIQDEYDEKEKDFDEELIDDLESRHEELVKKHEHFKTRIDEIEKLIEHKRKLIESIRKKKQTLEERNSEVKILSESINSLSKMREALSKSQIALRRQVIEAINGMMNDIWGDIYPYDDFKGLRLSIEEKRNTSDYELQLMNTSGNWLSVEGITSGGERTCAALTLRIAFAVVLAPGISWLVLDEPTHNLDSEGIDTLSEVFRERVPKIIDQLLLITHERSLESAVSGTLHRFSRDKSQDGPTSVERALYSE